MSLNDLAMRLTNQDAQLSGHGPLFYVRQLLEQGVVLKGYCDVLKPRLFFLSHGELHSILCYVVL